MKTLVIPDIHHLTETADRILETPHDRAIFLGDTFDDYDDTPADAEKTALWLKEKMRDPRNIFLWGNHDLHYFDRHFRCPGYTKAKSTVINDILGLEEWSRLKFIHQEQGWILSHAGFHPSLLPPGDFDFQMIQALILVDFMIQKRHASKWFAPGPARGGEQVVGGILWLDWEAEFEPIPGVSQIVGHSPGSKERKKSGIDSENYCIDSHLGSFVIIEDGGITVH